MIETVVQVFAQMAAGTLTAVSAGAGQALTELVRERLAPGEGGRRALRAVEETPDDPGAGSRLRALLEEVVRDDPDFGHRIAAILAEDADTPDRTAPGAHGAPTVPTASPTAPPASPTAPPASPTAPTASATAPTAGRSASGSITFDRSTVRGRNHTIALGPVTLHNTRNVRFTLLAVALVFAALVALGIYQGVQAVTGDGSPEHSVTALSGGAARQVLPDGSSLPAGWDLLSGPESGGAHLGSHGKGLDHLETVSYAMGDPDAELGISVAAFGTASEAADFFGYTTKKDTDPRLKMPRVGDDSVATLSAAGNGQAGGRSMILRKGTVVVILGGRNVEGRPFDPARLEVLARMMAARAQEAQDGKDPVAAARNA